MTSRLIDQLYRVTDSNGVPLSGALLYVYEAGTTTPINTYSDTGLASANANPIVSDSAGYFGDVFVAADDYKYVLKTSAGATLKTVDNLNIAATSSFSGGINSSGETERLVNAQTGTSYTVLDGDRSKLVTHSNANAIATTLPQANASTFEAGWYYETFNIGVGTATITPTTSTINDLATLTLPTNTGCTIVSDGTNYQIQGMYSIEPATNAQTGTSYTVLTEDLNKFVTHSNASAIATTLPQANTTTFKSGWRYLTRNMGAGDVTITPTTSTINGAATLVLKTGDSALIVSDGTNYAALVTSNRASLNLDTTDVVQLGAVQTVVTTVTSTSNATTIDLSVSDVFKHTFTENTTFTFSNPPASGINGGFKLLLINDGTGRTPTWPASVDWPNGNAPVLTTASETNILVFETFDGGTIWFGFLSGRAMA